MPRYVRVECVGVGCGRQLDYMVIGEDHDAYPCPDCGSPISVAFILDDNDEWIYECSGARVVSTGVGQDWEWEEEAVDG